MRNSAGTLCWLAVCSTLIDTQNVPLLMSECVCVRCLLVESSIQTKCAPVLFVSSNRICSVRVMALIFELTCWWRGARIISSPCIRVHKLLLRVCVMLGWGHLRPAVLHHSIFTHSVRFWHTVHTLQIVEGYQTYSTVHAVIDYGVMYASDVDTYDIYFSTKQT